MAFAAGAAAQPRTVLLPLPKQPPTRAPLDVTAAEVAADQADVHAVVIYEGSGTSVRRPRPMVDAVPGMPAVPSVKVTVAATGKPVVLVLGAYNSVFWDVHVAAGARLAKVIAQGHYQPFVSELPLGTRAIVYRSEPVVGLRPLFMSGDARAFYDLSESIRRLTGKPPATIQAAYAGGELAVDGASTLQPPALETLVAQPGRVAFALPLGPGGTSADGTVVSNCANDSITYATFKANRGYSRGRLYFEAELKTPGADRPPAERTNIGVMSLAASGVGRLLAPPSHLTGTGIPVLDPGAQGAMRNGSVVGLAIDLDAGRLHHRVDDRWIGGAPGSSGGVPLPGEGEYVAAAALGPSTACPGDQWTVNFGTKPFRFPLPAGFVAYTQGASPISAFPLHADIPRISRVSFDPQKGWYDRMTGAQSVITAATGGQTDRAARSARAEPPSSTPCGSLSDFEVHAVGVYQARNQPTRAGGARVPGSIRVDVVRPGARVCLLLMAYEPVEWLVGVAPGTTLVQAIAMGYYAQTVKGIAEPGLVTSWPSPTGSDRRAFWYYGERGQEGSFAQRTRLLTGKVASTFQGGYYGEGFIVDGNTTGVARAAERRTGVVRCGSTTIACNADDTVICGGRRVPCR